MEIDIIRDKGLWDRVIESFPNRDVYFSNGYFLPFSHYGDGMPCLFYLVSVNGRVAYPFMERDIAECPNLRGKIERGRFRDISSAYGYGGPLYETAVMGGSFSLLQRDFISAFSEYCASRCILSQFDRFHPLLRNHAFLEGYSELAGIRKTVMIDLSNPDGIWNDMESSCRNMIRKARKNGVSVRVDDDPATLDTFIELYQQTMKRNGTSPYYLFSSAFFRVTMDSLGKNMFIANACYGGKIIASSMFLRGPNFLHYHFSGSDPEFKNLQATSLLLYETALSESARGMKVFHLGGGFRSQNDPLFRFKRSFSRREPLDFFIGRKIHDPARYAELVRWAGYKEMETSFFPKYRAASTETR